MGAANISGISVTQAAKDKVLRLLKAQGADQQVLNLVEEIYVDFIDEDDGSDPLFVSDFQAHCHGLALALSRRMENRRPIQKWFGKILFPKEEAARARLIHSLERV